MLKYAVEFVQLFIGDIYVADTETALFRKGFGQVVQGVFVARGKTQECLPKTQGGMAQAAQIQLD